jgi:hypothetical protein
MPATFGSFDPAFLGPTLRFSDPWVWKRFEDFLVHDELEPLEGLTHRQRFVALSIQSVLSHEVRHFHDFLLSPYYAHIFSYRLKSALNVHELLPLLRRSGGNCLPVPLTRWGRFSSSERSRYLASLPARRDGSPWVPPEIPGFVPLRREEVASVVRQKGAGDSPTLETLLRVAAFQLERVGELATNANGLLQAWHPFELSGLLVQIQDLWHTHGEAACKEFLRGLGEEGPNTYTLLLDWAHPFSSGHAGFLDTIVASAAATWSLMGSYERDQWNACPSARLARLRERLTRAELVALYADPLSVFDAWSDKLGVTRCAEGLEEKKRIYDRLIDLVGSQGPSWGDPSEILRAIEAVAQASEYMTAAFLEDPLAYIAPHRYLSHVGNLVDPVVRFVFDDNCALEIPKSPEMAERVLWPTPDGSKVKSLLFAPKFSQVSCFDGPSLYAMGTLIDIYHLLFSETTPTRMSFEVRGAADLLEKQLGWRAIEIMN